MFTRLFLSLLFSFVIARAQLAGSSGPGMGSLAGFSPTPSWILSTFDGTNTTLTIDFSYDGLTWFAASPQVMMNNHGRDFSIHKISACSECATQPWWVAFTGTIDRGDSQGVWVSAVTSMPRFFDWTAGSIFVDCRSITGLKHAWAPEWFCDDGGACATLSAIHLFLTASASDYPNGFQIYETHPTSQDMFTLPWSNPLAITLTGNPSVIDVQVLKKGSTYYAIYANTGNNCIEMASSSTLTGTYTPIHTGNWLGIGCNGQEGPFLYQTVAGSPGTWMLEVDDSGHGLSSGQLRYTLSTDDWVTWSALVPFNTPAQAKQGTFQPYP